MEYISVSEFAEKHGVSQRTVRNYCATGKIDGVLLVGKTWSIPHDAALPLKGTLRNKQCLLYAKLGCARLQLQASSHCTRWHELCDDENSCK